MVSVWKKLSHCLCTILFWLVIALFLYVLCVRINAAISGNPAFYFGYRPLLVLSDSMEPTLMTNGMVLSKQVTKLSDLETGDIVTFQQEISPDTTISITHRIIDISEGIIRTKGDNNTSADPFQIRIEDVESKVVLICNQTAYISALWHTITGKLMIIGISATLAQICFFHCSGKREPDNLSVPIAAYGEIPEAEKSSAVETTITNSEN